MHDALSELAPTFHQAFAEGRRYQSGLQRIQICDDVLVQVDPQVIRPFNFADFKANISEDYFGEGAKTEDFLRFCIQRGWYSERSKVAQSSNLAVLNNAGNLFGNVSLDQSGRNVRFSGRLYNFNPVHAFQIRENPFALLRFFALPNRPLMGRALVDVVQGLNHQLIKFRNFTGELFSQDDVSKLTSNDALLGTDPAKALDKIDLPITQYANLNPKKPKIVDLESLLSIPAVQRSLIDQVLGFKWKNSYKSDGADLRVVIAQTPAVKLPSNVAGVIDEFMITRTEPWIMRHINSPLIDPDWGAQSKDGLPVRLEILYAGDLRELPKSVQIQLYPAGK